MHIVTRPSAYCKNNHSDFSYQVEKRIRSELRKIVEWERIYSLKPLLEELGNEHLPFMCLQHTDADGVLHQIPAVYLGKVDSLKTLKLKDMVSLTRLSFSPFVLTWKSSQVYH